MAFVQPSPCALRRREAVDGYSEHVVDGGAKKAAGMSGREPRYICMMHVLRIMFTCEARGVLIAVKMFGNISENIMIQYGCTM